MNYACREPKSVDEHLGIAGFPFEVEVVIV